MMKDEEGVISESVSRTSAPILEGKEKVSLTYLSGVIMSVGM